jgi:heterokaryon incompatibility protein (HET)
MFPVSTFSASFIATVHKWIQNCTSKHVRCGSSRPQQLPTRVIDVGLRQCSNIKLYESSGETGSYACLSHCWGPRGPGILTTSNTIKEYKRNIPWNLLPATFRDAVTVAWQLGLRYLWIDCLCVMQDSKEDWCRESGAMSSIFQKAFITLAATHAASADYGLFSELLISSMPREFKTYDCNGLPTSFYERELPHEFDWLDATLPGQEKFSLI